MTIRRAPAAWAALFTFVFSASASAQPPPPIQGTTTTTPALTLTDTLTQLVQPAGASRVGDALALATQLAIATTPFGASSGGFLIRLDPSTGLQVRTATTFGPSFAERALTNGEGMVSLGVNFAAATFDKLDDLDLGGLRVLSTTAASPAIARSGTTDLTVTSKTVVISGRVGVTDKLDVGGSVPLVTAEVKGTSTLRNGAGATILFAQGRGISKGLGDLAGLAKYRFVSFGTGQPDPGGLAVMATMRLPTGKRESLRGLGVTRTTLSLIASSGRRRFRPHGNVGYGYWSKGVTVASDSAQNATVEARHHFEYAAGVELEAAPKLTLLVDLLGGQIFGGGKVGISSITPGPGVTSAEALVALPEGPRRVSLAPGLKANLKGKLLLSLNALVALSDSGLHTRVIPVVGIDLNF